MSQSVNPSVSVIVPAYRTAATIERTLRSIATQTVKPMEIIVVDDGSDDGTADIARKCVAIMGDISLTVIEQDNLGAGAARNRALDDATGELVAFLDADDEWLPEKLERSLSIMAETGADLVSHNYVMIDGDTENLVDCTRHFQGHTAPYISLYLRGYVATSTVVVQRHLIAEAGGFDAGLRSGQDFDLWLSIAGREDVSFHIFDQALTRYYVTAGSITSRVAERRRCSMIILLRHAQSLAGRSRWGKLYSLARAAIISLQASAAYRAQDKTMAALGALVRAPFAVMKVGGIVFAGPLAALWICGVSLGYVVQFQSYIDPIFRLVGFK